MPLTALWTASWTTAIALICRRAPANVEDNAYLTVRQFHSITASSRTVSGTQAGATPCALALVKVAARNIRTTASLIAADWLVCAFIVIPPILIRDGIISLIRNRLDEAVLLVVTVVIVLAFLLFRRLPMSWANCFSRNRRLRI